jgi:hypothetical protein
MAGTRQGGRNRELIITTVTITLPTASGVTPGGDIMVLGAANQALIVAPATADTLVGLNDLDLDSVALQTASEMIGGALLFTCLGPVWHVAYMTEETQSATSVD